MITLKGFEKKFSYDQMTELNSLIKELKLILYGDDDSEPCAEACTQLTEEFFKEDTLRLLIIFLPKLNLEASIQLLLHLDFVTSVQFVS